MAMAMAMASAVRPFLPLPLFSGNSIAIAPRCSPLFSDRPPSSSSPPPLQSVLPLRSIRPEAKPRISAKIDNDGEEATERAGNFVERSEAALGKLFGGTVWFSVLLAALFLFAGGYIYLVVNFADFSDIPIFAVR